MKNVAVIGGGPAGLMAAEVLATAGVAVTVYERKPTAGRKFLMAGRGGLNLTHSEDLEKFMTRYGAAAAQLKPIIAGLTPAMLQEWCEGLGQPVFIGSSGRVFPESFKASPLLRAWRARLDDLGVKFLFQHDWQGWDEEGSLVFKTADKNSIKEKPAAVVLALGGASWPRLGSDGSWVPVMEQQKIQVTPLRPSNCGFVVKWSGIFRGRFAGQPLKPVVLSFGDDAVQGEMMIGEKGVEGGTVYALSGKLRDAIAVKGSAVLMVDLRPGLAAGELASRLKMPRRGKSFSNFLRKEGGLSPVAIGLLRESEASQDIQLLGAEGLAALIKALPLCLTAPFPIERAISTAGGIAFDALTDELMLRKKPGVFAAGEMLDWEAPTGGYLLQASFATGAGAACGVLGWLQKNS